MKILRTAMSAHALLGHLFAQQDSTTAKIPFDGMNLSWINGQDRQRDYPLTFKKNGETIITGIAYLDTYYNYNLANVINNTQTISSTIGRHNEITLNLASVRQSSIPYFTGAGGTMSASCWTNGSAPILPWVADLKKMENRITLTVNIRL